MKKLLIYIFLLIGIQASAQTPKAVFVIADGIPADVIERLKLPGMQAIINDGAYIRMHVGGDKGTYNQTPTISAVGYNSLLTGTWVNKHNVPDNDIKDPNYNYPTIFRLFKDQYPNKKIAVFSSWQDNRTKLVGDNLPQTRNLKVDYYADGFELDTVNFKHDKKRDFMHRIDEQVVDKASDAIKTKAPDLSWVYLEYTDDMGHMHGDSPEMETAVKYLDAQLTKLYNAIKYREAHTKEKWLLVVTTDHGRDEQTGRNHGGQSERQRDTWMITNYKNLNNYARLGNPAIVDIMPTLANYLKVNIPENVTREVDGTSLIGPVSVADVKLNYIQGTISVSWKPFKPEGKVKIYVTTTNNVKTSGTDEYKLLQEADVKDGHALINVKDMPSKFYKVVLQAPYNTANRWLVIP
ncbi:alkaline phosphatase family protein [Mucilaginibacter sp. KACC 22063]|uniref:alkaline phosphatase family protein n=1 Tax=Mucilaginibacter sp. KACC 22063 TaxID=3025666 RepID=UPI00236539CF|nr:alkaline phosphatase family protein [Mucilaginibacter sp. KACC 22063]WDF55648.1 alkaline phosphatase family protein [Mucilaginibacter sp. KACC 22063]